MKTPRELYEITTYVRDEIYKAESYLDNLRDKLTSLEEVIEELTDELSDVIKEADNAGN